jgi:hypothetical protein
VGVCIGKDKYSNKMAASGKGKLEWDDDSLDNRSSNVSNDVEGTEYSRKRPQFRSMNHSSQNGVMAPPAGQQQEGSSEIDDSAKVPRKSNSDTANKQEQVTISNDVTVIGEPFKIIKPLTNAANQLTREESDSDKSSFTSSMEKQQQAERQPKHSLSERIKYSSLSPPDEKNRRRATVPSSAYHAWKLDEDEGAREFRRRNSVPLHGLLAHSRQSMDSVMKELKSSIESDKDAGGAGTDDYWQLYASVTAEDEVPQDLGHFSLNVEEHNEIEDGPVTMCAGKSNAVTPASLFAWRFGVVVISR